jgi:hypothetical protein
MRAIAPRTRGLVAFARAGQNPFWLELQFEVPLPTWITMGSTPNIYHLVELKDNYDRYVVLLTTEASARIMSMNLRSITANLWQSRPELCRRARHEWSRDHFQDHRREYTKRFINEQIRTLDGLISAAGYGHLILAGNPRMIAEFGNLCRNACWRKLSMRYPQLPAIDCRTWSPRRCRLFGNTRNRNRKRSLRN